jgi:hypothetical protein
VVFVVNRVSLKNVGVTACLTRFILARSLGQESHDPYEPLNQNLRSKFTINSELRIIHYSAT